MNHRSPLNKLSKKQLVHLVENIEGITAFKAMRAMQIDAEKRSDMVLCHECRVIGRILFGEEKIK